MSTKKTAALNVLDLGTADFADDSIDVTVWSLAKDKRRVEITLVCVNEISEGARDRYRKLMRKHASHVQKLIDEAHSDEEKASVNDEFTDIMRRCDAVARAIDWKDVEQKFDTETLYSVLLKNPHWIDDILFKTSVKKIGASN